MLFDGKLGQVVYVNGAGHAWAWDGSSWASLALPGGPIIPVPGSGIESSTFAVGYDEGRAALVYVLATATWLWDGSGWKEVPGGVEAGQGRADAHAVYDRVHRQLVYVGRDATWTWDGSRWQWHSQDPISTGTVGYDEVSAHVLLVEEDSSSCDETACQSITWAWNSITWASVQVASGPRLPVTRSGAFGMPMAFDEARGVMVLFASAS
jgi:hypothetical protein